MSSKYNQLYGNPALNRALGNIAKTLVGSATDDAAIARANYIDSQTVGQNLKNENMTDLQANIPKATSVLANNILRANTGKPNAQFNQSGVPFVDGGNMSMPVSGNPNILPPASMTQENYQGTARAMLGDLSYNPNQFAAAIANLGSAETAKLAQNLISGGNADEMRRGAILNNMNPGQFFDKGTAQTKIQNDLNAKNYNSEKNLEASKYNTNVKNETTKEDLKQKRIITKELGIKKIEKIAEVAKYKFDNREIKIAVGKDQKVYIDMDTADKLGVEATIENGEEVYVINGKQSQDKVDQVKVNVGKADVFLSKEMADKLGIPVNDQGQYIIEGSGYNDGTGSGARGSKSGMKANDVSKTLANLKTSYEQFDNFTENLPQAVIGKIEDRIFKMMKDDMDDGMSRDQAFISNARGVISQGSVEISTGIMSSFNAPRFFVDHFRTSRDTDDQVTKFFKSLSYNDKEAKAITSFIRPSN